MPFTYAYYSIGPHLDENGFGYEVRLFNDANEQIGFRVFRSREEVDEHIQELRDMGQLDDC